jgi:hypothetical protein
MTTQTFRKGETVQYHGGPVPAHELKLGTVCRTDRKGWVHVDFGNGCEAPCSPLFLRAPLTAQTGPTTMSSYRTEFPDYTAADLPAIPANWEDVSWHNDVCPSWVAPGEVYVYADYADPQRREMQNATRYAVMHDGVVLLETDDWDAVLTLVANPPLAA